MDNDKNIKEKTVKQIVGELGEHFAAKHLVSRHFVIKEQNYRKTWGELDIIAEKNNALHFVEVKSVVINGFVSHVTPLGLLLWRISTESTLNVGLDNYFPEENVHLWKQRRMARAIQTYLLEKRIPEEKEWQIDVVAVFLDFSKKYAIIRYLDDVIFYIKVA